MSLELIRHPLSKGTGAYGVAARLEWPAPDRTRLTFNVAARPGAVAVPPPAPPVRTDELWRHTCLEMFVQVEGEAGYLEFNLAPSGAWAAYRFDGYRNGMRPAEGFEAPTIALAESEGGFTLAALVDVGPGVPSGAPLRIGFSAVIEDADGSVAYWALNHPSERPDFHHPDGFSLRVSPAQRA